MVDKLDGWYAQWLIGLMVDRLDGLEIRCQLNHISEAR